jgi:alpha-beta hydrolase superfamily lysophospholipase
VLLQAALANFNPNAPTKVDFNNDDRAPLLIIGGGVDHVVPAAVTREAAGHYRHAEAITAYKEFPGRSHYTLGQPDWEEVADYALAWARASAGSANTPAGAGAR